MLSGYQCGVRKLRDSTDLEEFLVHTRTGLQKFPVHICTDFEKFQNIHLMTEKFRVHTSNDLEKFQIHPSNDLTEFQIHTSNDLEKLTVQTCTNLMKLPVYQYGIKRQRNSQSIQVET